MLVLKLLAMLIACYVLWRGIARFRPGLQKAVAWLLLCIGVVVATVFGTTTQWVLPGFQGAALGAGAGWVIGMVIFSFIGPQGIVPLGIAIGARVMALIFSGVGGVSGLAGSIGPKTVVSIPAMIVWVPIVVLAFVIYGRAKKA